LDKFVLGIFVDEIMYQCKSALTNWNYLQANLRQIRDWSKEDYRKKEEQIFCHIQAFLVAVANISKLLWPKARSSKSRGEELRRILQVPMNSPIRAKEFRNVFEHYDKEIERWACSSTKKNYCDMNISIGGFSAISVDPQDMMRNLDISRDGKSLTLTFHGDSYRLTITERAVRQLLEIARSVRPKLW